MRRVNHLRLGPGIDLEDAVEVEDLQRHAIIAII